MPINILFYFTIPDVKKESCRKFVVFSFVVCIVWIGVTSYILVWMVTIIGYTFMIPDTVMGLSLVAFGSSVPDCLSSLFVAQKGRVDTESSYTFVAQTTTAFLTYCLANWSQDSDWFLSDPIIRIWTVKLVHIRITFGGVIFENIVMFIFKAWFPYDRPERPDRPSRLKKNVQTTGTIIWKRYPDDRKRPGRLRWPRSLG